MTRKLLLSLISLCFYLPWLGFAQDEEIPSTPTGSGFYVSMHPHFLANLAGSKRFAQIKAQALVANEATGDALKLHMPQIRHRILMLLSETTAEQLRTAQDKKAFRAQAVAIMKEVLEKYNQPADVEDFFMTSFILQ